MAETKSWLENTLSIPQNSMTLLGHDKTVLGIRFVANNGTSCFVDLFTNIASLPTAGGAYPDFPTSRLNELFNLQDIDLNSIKAKQGVIEPWPVPKVDEIYSYVTFNTTNNVDDISRVLQDLSDRKEGDARLYNDSGLLPSATSPSANPSKESEVRLTMHSSYAPRFVTALRHAVELCGGKPSAF